MRKWLAKLIYKEVFITEEDLRIRNVGITNELRVLKKENKILKDDFERFKTLDFRDEFLGTFMDKLGVEIYKFRKRSDAERSVTIYFLQIKDKGFNIAGNYGFSLVGESTFKIHDCANEGYKNRGHGSVFMKYLFDDIKLYEIKEVVGDLVREDGTEDSKNRREHFYKKFGFDVLWDDKDRTTGKINLTIDKCDLF